MSLLYKNLIIYDPQFINLSSKVYVNMNKLEVNYFGNEMEAPAQSIDQTKDSTTHQFGINAPLLSNTPNNKYPHISIHYRNWRISTKAIHGQVWLQWQHPQESFPRYGTPVVDNRLSDTLRYARAQIDLMIELEQQAQMDSISQPSSQESTNSYSFDVHVGANGNTPHSVSSILPEPAEDLEEFLLSQSRWGY